MCPWTSEMNSFSSLRGARPTNSAEQSYSSDVTRVFSHCLFDLRAPKM
jgi:hypothetical protein